MRCQYSFSNLSLQQQCTIFSFIISSGKIASFLPKIKHLSTLGRWRSHQKVVLTPVPNSTERHIPNTWYLFQYGVIPNLLFLQVNVLKYQSRFCLIMAKGYLLWYLRPSFKLLLNLIGAPPASMNPTILPLPNCWQQEASVQLPKEWCTNTIGLLKDTLLIRKCNYFACSSNSVASYDRSASLQPFWKHRNLKQRHSPGRLKNLNYSQKGGTPGRQTYSKSSLRILFFLEDKTGLRLSEAKLSSDNVLTKRFESSTSSLGLSSLQCL